MPRSGNKTLASVHTDWAGKAWVGHMHPTEVFIEAIGTGWQLNVQGQVLRQSVTKTCALVKTQDVFCHRVGVAPKAMRRPPPAVVGKKLNFDVLFAQRHLCVIL